MNHHPIFRFLMLCLTVLLFVTPVRATEATTKSTTEATTDTTTLPPRAPDQCGETMFWNYDSGVLTISGQGLMDDFSEGEAPWQEYHSQITQIVFTGDITYIGAYAFRNYDSLTTVDFGNAMYEIGKEAFASCDGLTEISLPATFKVFGESCLQNCKNLTAIRSAGRFPSFRQNCLWDTYATIYYPAEKPWDIKYIDQLEAAFRGRIQFIASDGTDPNAPTETTAEPTEATTEVTTQATTQATTAPATASTTASTIMSQPPATTVTSIPPQETDPTADFSEKDTGDFRQILLTVTLFIAIFFTLMALALLIIQYRNRRMRRRRRPRKNIR